MADQKSRGGQKQGNAKQPGGKKNRDVRATGVAGQHNARDMAEDADRGAAGRQEQQPASQPQGGQAK